MVWSVVRWEVMRHLRNKQFIIGLFLTPVLMVVFFALPSVVERLEQPRQVTYVVVDELQAAAELQTMLAESTVTLKTLPTEDEAVDAVLAGDAEGYFVLSDDFIRTGVITIHMEKQRQRPEALSGALAALLQDMRMKEQAISADVLAYVSARPTFVTSIIDAEEDDVPLRGLPVSIAMIVVLTYLIVSSGSMLLQSAIQEKRDRMSEVVLSSIDADTLMTGKIIGHFVLGIVQIGFWALIVVPMIVFVLDVPIGDYVLPHLLPLQILFMLLGYLFFAALYVGIGATMEDLQSASNTQGLVFMLPLLPFLFLSPILNNPEGVIAKVLTLLPITTPTIVIMRIGLEATAPWEIALAVPIMLASTWLVVKAASRLFRTGMLMYGKTASWREMWHWIRYPD